jgi:hypothetical protein
VNQLTVRPAARMSAMKAASVGVGARIMFGRSGYRVRFVKSAR